ncbi:PQQ-binding-like beta-propeller repeat protein [Actinomadura sp. CNU-125]|uniref:PQQ-binding-like beta-propeller repeat protein n=1 Tax=Actinomadura sp. CNU-125 TaxID=1904961 RepID=UPI0021CC7815|nr:PQQ-binding-like beta-propeller repeat protein [Actinomadura sp. CNU-125]
MAGDVLYLVGGRGEHVQALDCATGAVRWTSRSEEDEAESGRPDATLRVADGTVYLSVGGRLVRALDARTGRVRWLIRPRSARDDASPEPPTAATAPAIVGNTVLLGMDDGTFRAFDKRDGRERWAVATGAVAPGAFRRRAAPPAGNGLVFVRGADAVRALRVRDGRVHWEHPTDPSAGEPVLAGGALHVPGRWEVTSHDPADGRVVQRLDLHRRRGPTAVLAGRDALYVLAGPDAVIAVGLP